jgi:hypothetical protein
MNVLRSAGLPSPQCVLQIKLQPTHIVHVLGGDESSDPNETLKGVALMPKAKKKVAKKKVAKKAKKKK